MRKERFVFRLGISTSIPSLLAGEGGWDVDTKALRVGDDTSIPTKIPTTKSLGAFEFPLLDYVAYPEIRIFDNGLVDGVRLSELRANRGLLVRGLRTDDNGTDVEYFAARRLEGDDYITIDNPDGSRDNPRIRVSDTFLAIIDRLAGAGGFSFGADPPIDAKPGHMFWSTVDELLYVLVTDDSTNRWWIDIGSGGGSASRPGNATWIGSVPPVTALIGDRFLDADDDYRSYQFMRDNNSSFWVETPAY